MIVEDGNGSINRLDDTAIGRNVHYVPSHAKDDRTQWETGRIKSYNNERRIAWVVYDHGNNSMIDHYQEYTAASTNYDDLKFRR
jgi:hypothetical protein